MRKLISAFIFCFCLLATHAQDPNFSQFFASPLTLNPAMTGKFNGDFRVAGNYRNQWPTINNAFTTYTVSADFSILKNHISEVDQFGVGIMAFSDQSGNGILKNNYIALSTAYHKSLDEDGYNQIGAGFQGTFVNKRLDITKVYFEDQLTPLGFTGVTSELFPASQINVSYFDANMGLLYNGTSNGENNYYAGVSMYHINRPKETFKGGQFLLPARITIQAGGMLPLADGDGLHFSANHSQQAKATNTVIGGAYMKNLNPEQPIATNLYLGTWFRLGDAIIPYIGLEFGEFH